MHPPPTKITRFENVYYITSTSKLLPQPPSFLKLSFLSLCHSYPFIISCYIYLGYRVSTVVIYQVESSNATQVRLTGLSLASTGRYRCEVSAEAPSFQTVSDHGDMMSIGESQFAVLSHYSGKPKLFLFIKKNIMVLPNVYCSTNTVE